MKQIGEQHGGQRTGAPSRVLEGLWVRLHVEGRIRVQDALRLRDLGIAPFSQSPIYRLDSAGYVEAVGLPGNEKSVVSRQILAALEAAYGNRSGR